MKKDDTDETGALGKSWSIGIQTNKTKELGIKMYYILLGQQSVEIYP